MSGNFKTEVKLDLDWRNEYIHDIYVILYV
jgi:hypothetical protein